MNGLAAQQFIEVLHQESKGAIRAEVVGRTTTNKRSAARKADFATLKVCRIRLVHRRLNRVMYIGQWSEWGTIKQAWEELEREEDVNT